MFEIIQFPEDFGCVVDRGLSGIQAFNPTN